MGYNSGFKGLNMFSKDQTNFELLNKTQGVELLRRYIASTISH